MKRVFLIVLDSFGIGAMPDAESFGDVGVNTLRACATSPKLDIPNMTAAGLGNIDGVTCLPKAAAPTGAFARLTETFRELHEKGGRTILIISHQERIIRLADEIILIANGEIAGRGTADELYPKLLSQTVVGCNLLEVNGIC